MGERPLTLERLRTDGNQEGDWGGILWGLAESDWHLREQKGPQVPARAGVTSICGRGEFAF